MSVPKIEFQILFYTKYYLQSPKMETATNSIKFWATLKNFIIPQKVEPTIFCLVIIVDLRLAGIGKFLQADWLMSASSEHFKKEHWHELEI